MTTVAVLAIGCFFGAGSISAAADAEPEELPIAAGPAESNLDTLRHYECPAWFQDAKLGFRVEWSPANIPELGPGYASNFKFPGRRHHAYHVENFGHPDDVGYEALVERWTGEKFDASALMDRFAAAGAKYFVALAVDDRGVRLPWTQLDVERHPFRGALDVVKEFGDAARTREVRFGLSIHTPASHELRGSKTGTAFVWFSQVHDLVDDYRPELIYALGTPAEEAAEFAAMAHFYNRTIEWHQDLTGVYTARATLQPHIVETGVETVERGSKAEIAPRPWQCDTPLNDWVYDRELAMRPAKGLVHLLADVVSKNGNLLLNVPLRGDGSLPEDAGVVLDEMGAWLAVNGEAIFGTRPWRVFGEGPTETIGGPLGENQTLPYTPEDIRYTRKIWLDDDVERETLYAIVLGWPGANEEVVLGELASGPDARAIGTVRLLGYDGALRILRDGNGLHIQLPAEPPSAHAIVFRID